MKSAMEGQIDIDPEWFELVINAMVEVNTVGTGARVMSKTQYEVAGKTGSPCLVCA